MLPIPPQLVALLAMSLTDKLIELMRPEAEVPEEWRAKVRAEMQVNADASEDWLEEEIKRLKAKG